MIEKKILIVDDDKDILMILEARLSKVGYKVIKANSGIDAIAIAKSEHLDLIILDIVMPDKGGEEIAEELKNNPMTKNIPIMFLTCLYTKKEEMKQGHKIDGNVIFAKPYNPQELLKEINALLVSKA